MSGVSGVSGVLEEEVAVTTENTAAKGAATKAGTDTGMKVVAWTGEHIRSHPPIHTLSTPSITRYII